MEKDSDLNLRLGLPGLESTGLELRLDSLSSVKGFVVSSGKRAFFDDGVEKWGLSFNGGSELMGLGDGSKGDISCHVGNEAAVCVPIKAAPAAKAHVVGWPPIRSFRKNTIATSSGKKDENVEKSSPGSLFVKVSMDGAPYLRKVDLKTYSNYMQLSSALKKMFSCFTIGHSESNLKDLNGSEYVLTFEDKDGDWMLVGDVPWGMFTDSCKKLRIMKGSDAIGLAPRATEKLKS